MSVNKHVYVGNINMVIIQARSAAAWPEVGITYLYGHSTIHEQVCLSTEKNAFLSLT